MPLKEGGSQEIISANIAMLMREYRRTGKIGNTRPDNQEHALEIASAIARDKATETNPKIPKGK